MIKAVHVRLLSFGGSLTSVQWMKHVGGKEDRGRADKSTQVVGGKDDIMRDKLKHSQVPWSGGENTTHLYFEVDTKCFRKKRGF